MKTNTYFRSYLAQFFLESEMFQTNIVDEIKKQNLFTIIFFSENGDTYEIIWKNTVELGRPQMTIWRMRIACWVPKAADISSEYVKFTAFLLQ
jgi:hypothetical protein